MITSTLRRSRCKHSHPRIAASDRFGVPVLSVAHDRPWDAGDLTLLVGAVDRLAARHSAVGISLAGVHRLPTGFWERLCRWRERGLEVLLFDPGPEVRTMLWFRLSARPHDSLSEAFAVMPDLGVLCEKDEVRNAGRAG